MYDGIKPKFRQKSAGTNVTVIEAVGRVEPMPDKRWSRAGLINPAERRKTNERRCHDDQRVSGFNLRSGRDRRKGVNRYPKIEIKV